MATPRTRVKFGPKQFKNPTPYRWGLFWNLVSYGLAGIATISWIAKYPDLPVILLLIAGGIDKYIKPMFGIETEINYEHEENRSNFSGQDQTDASQPPIRD